MKNELRRTHSPGTLCLESLQELRLAGRGSLSLVLQLLSQPLCQRNIGYRVKIGQNEPTAVSPRSFSETEKGYSHVPSPRRRADTENALDAMAGATRAAKTLRAAVPAATREARAREEGKAS